MEITNSLIICISLTLVIVGALNCFLGYKLFRIELAFMGFFIGAAIGVFLGLAITVGLSAGGGDMSSDASGAAALLTIFITVLIGALGAALAYSLYMIGLFFNIVLVGGMLFFILFRLVFGVTDVTTCLAIAIIGGVICGIIGCVLHKSIVVISTALKGALFMAVPLEMLMGYVIDVSPVGGFLEDMIWQANGIWNILITISYISILLRFVAFTILGIKYQMKRIDKMQTQSVVMPKYVDKDKELLNQGGWRCTCCSKVNPSDVTMCFCGASKRY